MSDVLSNELRLADLDLQGYSLTERLNGIALLQDPTRCDIVRFAAQEIERLSKANAEMRAGLEDVANYNGRGRIPSVKAIAKATLSALERLEK